MRLNSIPLASALLPAIAVNLCYLLAARQGHIPWCFPFFDHCVSISSTGRESPESYVFRASIIPTAVIMMLYWRLSYEWFKTLGGRMAACNLAMLWLGVVACLGLILYTTILGAIGDAYHVQRRIGVMLFYALTMVAQLLMTIQISFAVRSSRALVSRRIFRILIILCGTTVILGILNIFLSEFYPNFNHIDDAFEWTITLLILMYFFTTHFAWKETGFEATFTVSGR